MTVFKGYLKLINRNKGIGLIYLGIFIVMTFLIQSAYSTNPDTGGFNVTSIDIAVVDNDSTVMSKGLIEYLNKDNDVDMIDEADEEIVELMYYDYIDYVVVIPKGYQDAVIEGNATVDVTKGSSITRGVFGDMSIIEFSNELHVLKEAGYKNESAVESAIIASRKQADVEIIDKSGNDGQIPEYYNFMRYVPFLYLGVLCFLVGSVMLEFRKDDVKRRIKCGAIPPITHGLSSFGAFVLLSALVFVITWAISLMYYGGNLLNDSNLSLIVINNLAMLLSALSISFLIGVAVKNDTVLSGATNVVSLGLCFIGGVFVPLEMLGGFMKNVAKFLPTYWFENNLSIIAWHPNMITNGGIVIEKYIEGIFVQLAMASVMIVLALVLRRMENKAE